MHEAHPDWEFTVLVRSEEKAKPVTAAFPKVKVAISGLGDSKVLEEAAAAADIVLRKLSSQLSLRGNCTYSNANADTADSSDHEGAARAISKGLLSHDASRPGYLIHVGGTGILCWHDMDNKRYGQAPLPEQAYDDLEGVGRLLNLPDTAFHRNIDKIILETAAAKPEVAKVAIVCPPTIYGAGRGPVNQRSRQVPTLVETTLKHGFGPKIVTGRTEWDDVHVHDLANLFVLLADNAVSKSRTNEDEIWGAKAYYLAENGVHVWGDVAEWAANAAASKGFLSKADTKNLSVDEAKEINGFEAVSWGLNSKGKAKRARKYLGWTPKGKSLQDTIPETVEAEAKRMGIAK